MSIETKHVFQYLSALNSLQAKNVFDMSSYETSFFFRDIPKNDFIRSLKDTSVHENWLEVDKVTITEDDLTPPPVPELVKEWVSFDIHNYEISSEDVLWYEHLTLNDETVLFEDDVVRVAAFDEWKTKWLSWKASVEPKFQAKSLYSRLFNLLQDIQKDVEDLELSVGLGFLTWKTDTSVIRHPLFTVKSDLFFDKDSAQIYIRPRLDSLQFEEEILSTVSLSNISIYTAILNEIKQFDYLHSPLDELNTLLLQLVSAIHVGGSFEKQSDTCPTYYHPTIYAEPTFFVRNQKNQLLKKELDTINELLAERGITIPKPVQALTGKGVEEKDVWEDTLENIYFPLPANEEQKDIVRKLATDYGVAVQGPPGTGKSHTIANIVCHLLAHGKKILITSQKEKALSVLKDKLPKDIQDLCVPVLGGGRDSFKMIEQSINTISEKLSNENPDILESKANELIMKLDENKRQEARLKNQIKSLDEQLASDIFHNDKKLTRMDMAKHISFHQDVEHAWIPDKVSLDTSFPLSDEEFSTLWMHTSSLSQQDYLLKDYYLVSKEDLPSLSEMEAFFEKGQKLKRSFQEVKRKLPSFHADVTRSVLLETNKHLSEAIRIYESLSTERLLLSLLSSMFHERSTYDLWKDEIQQLQFQHSSTISSFKQLLSYQFSLPSDKTWHQLEGDIKRIQTELTKGKLSLLFKMGAGKKVKYLITQPIINQHPIETLEDCEAVLLYLSYLKKRQDTLTHWNNLSSTIGYHQLKDVDHTTDSTLSRYLETVETVLKGCEHLRTASTLSRSLFSHSVSWTNVSQLKKVSQDITTFHTIFTFRSWEDEASQKVSELRVHTRKPMAHDILHSFIASIEEHSFDKWKVAYETFEDLHAIQQKATTCYSLFEKLRKTAPLLTQQVENQWGHTLPYPSDYKVSWELKGMKSYLDTFNDAQYESLRDELKEVQEKQHTLMEQIVVHSTWANQLRNITDEQHQSLSAWKYHIKKLGKTGGKYSHVHLRNAQKEMESCKDAIPVWIMPIQQIRQNFLVNSDMFDVVIFDESSQCDIFSLPVLLRAKKAIVVGDNEQIVPMGVGVSHEKIHQLMHQYLGDSRIGKMMDLKTSLYDVAEQIFPKDSRLMLREHFRCVPEIIQFSNDLSYDGKIIPLRLPLPEEKMASAVMAVKVEDGYCSESSGSNLVNRPEAEAIVEDIYQCLHQPEYVNQTFAVVSLQGKKQADLIQHLLRDKIGEVEFMKRQIRCGDAYDLQGDERDIVYLSMVIAPNRPYKARTSEDDQRRYNVAVSRARNQVKLFHSVDLADLNGTDLRARLLSYCMNPHRILEEKENVLDRCESPFEREVAERIMAKGYKVTPQVEVGGCRIDLVVEGISSRLAVECDGEKWHGPEKWEEDMKRQCTLERAGWTFWRVRGSQFYVNKDDSLTSLWKTLEEMNIEKNYTN